MASPAPEPPRSRQTSIAGDDEAARDREVHRYFRPLQDVSEQPSDGHKPYSSADRALTAFAQLGALRLNAQRGMISLIDRKNQYVLAEATRTLSLQRDDVHADNDSLWVGVFDFPRNRSTCEHTAGLITPTKEEQEKAYLDKDGIMIFPDLEDNVHFCDQPMVTDWPHCRFYAGVPIISPEGYKIGSYCVMDDVPREGLTDIEKGFMQDMAATVMSHLEMVRAKNELRRSQNMVHGLGSFIDGKSNLRDWWNSVSYPSNYRRESTRQASGPESHEKPVRPGLASIREERRSWQSSETTYSLGKSSRERRSVRSASSYTSSGGNSNPGASPFSGQQNAKSEGNVLQERSLSENVQATFQRAALLVREAVDVDGALFLDASVGSYGGLVPGVKERKLSNADSGAGGSISSALSDAQEITVGDSNTAPLTTVKEKICSVLGSSIAPHRPHLIPEMSEQFLQSLLQEYPKGRIWSFSREEAGITHDPDQDPSTLPFNRKGKRWHERRMIQKFFPGVRSLAFVGMWDHHRSRWFAGSVLWTCWPTRIISSELELNYLIAFGQSIMAEVTRLDFLMADQAKATFISSISHELRTPLHGIMGSSEHLQSTELDALQQSLVELIDVSSSTLLHCLDNLLSYAKINSYMSGFGQKGLNAREQKASGTKSYQKENVDIGSLAEEVVETVVAGHGFFQTSAKGAAADSTRLALPGAALGSESALDKSRSNGAVSVILDYDPSLSSQWVYRTQQGVWRRIMLNLVGNSLKYTDHGFVVVRLTTASSPKDETEDNLHEVTLEVCDSGRGMSRDFLKTHLFSPFVQEDPLTPGTGLGLSIVKQLVQSMGGNISVKSKKNVGTETRITVPLVPVANHAGESPKMTSIPDVIGKCENARMLDLGSIVAKPAATGLPHAHQDFSFADFCKKWFGLQSEPEATQLEHDIYVIHEDHVPSLIAALPTKSIERENLSRKPMIVLCKNPSSAFALKTSGVAASASCYVEFLSQPYGPNKVAKALSLCFDALDSGRCSWVAKSRDQPPAPAYTAERESGSTEMSEVPSIVLDETHTKRDKRGLGRTRSASDCGSATEQTMQKPHSLRDALARRDHDHTGSDADQSDTVSVASTSDAMTKPKTSVLLVDDNRINLQLLATFMRKQQHSFDTAMNGQEAVEVYKASASKLDSSDKVPSTDPAYHFILMDLNMPVMDGLQATRRIRAYERSMGARPSTIIALTGMANASAQQEAFASGIDIFLTKPVRFKELTRILEKKDSRAASVVQ